MKKNKLLKMIGCVALVTTPVIVAPIVMSTSCSTTDPTPTSLITLNGSQNSEIITGTGGNIAITAKTNGTLKTGTVTWNLENDPNSSGQKLDGITVIDKTDLGCKVNVDTTVVASTYHVILIATGEVNDKSITSDPLKLTITVDQTQSTVTSIQGIKLMQGEKNVLDKEDPQGVANYKSSQVTQSSMPAIDLTIEIYFYINNDPTPVRLSTIINKDEIVLGFVCSVCGNDINNVFEIEDNNIVISNQKVMESVEAGDNFCQFVHSHGLSGRFVIGNDSDLRLSYNMKGESEVGTATILFAEI